MVGAQRERADDLVAVAHHVGLRPRAMRAAPHPDIVGFGLGRLGRVGIGVAG